MQWFPGWWDLCLYSVRLSWILSLCKAVQCPVGGKSHVYMGFLDSSPGKESACNTGDPGSIPGLGRSTGEGIGYPLQYSWVFLMAQLVKNPPAMRETCVWSLGGKIPWRREWLPTTVFLPGEFHGQSSLAGYSPWDHRVGHD